MSKWIEHIDNGDGTPICDKNSTNRDVVNDIFCDVDPEVMCKECIKKLSKLMVEDFGSFRAALESKPVGIFKLRMSEGD